MLGTACYYYLAAIFINKLYCITDKITPDSCTGAQEQTIFFSFFNFIYEQSFRVLNYITIVVKIFIIEWNKLEKDVFVGYKAHASCILPVLICNKTFTCKICF